MVKDFLGCDPYSIHGPNGKTWQEWHMQAYVVQEARRMGYVVAADMNAGKRNGAKAKAEGMQAGETDLRFYLPGAMMALIELKRGGNLTPRKTWGSVSKAQKELHETLRGLGFYVAVVFADSPAAMWDKVRELLPEL